MCYAATNVFLRASAVSADAVIASTLRLVPVTFIALLLALRAGQIDTIIPHRLVFKGSRALCILLLSGVISYFIGNNAYQLALRYGGITGTVPAAQSASLWGGIILGSTLLGEHFKRGVVGGGLIVMLGLLLLFSRDMPLTEIGPLALPLALMAGLSYAISNILIRRAYRYGMTQYPALLINTLGGLTPLLITAWLQQGPNIFATTSAHDLWLLLVAGVLNAGALLSLSRALTLTTSSRVNTINTSSIALSAIFAVVIFKEMITPAILSGIVLIIAGIVIVQRYLIPHRA